MRFGVAIVAALLLAGTASAEETLADCAGIDADLDRLACYDRVSGRTPRSEVIPTPSKWIKRIETSELTDETNVFLSVRSKDRAYCSWGGGELTLVVRCMENTTAFYFQGDCHMASGHGGYGRVDARVDDRPAIQLRMQDSTNNRALGLWRGNRSIPVIKKLLGGKRLLIRFTPFGESSQTVEFPIAGLEEEIAPLREACGW